MLYLRLVDQKYWIFKYTHNCRALKLFYTRLFIINFLRTKVYKLLVSSREHDAHRLQHCPSSSHAQVRIIKSNKKVLKYGFRNWFPPFPLRIKANGKIGHLFFLKKKIILHDGGSVGNYDFLLYTY